MFNTFLDVFRAQTLEEQVIPPNATVRQISDVSTFEWTITESLLTAGVLATITVQYA